MQPLEPSLTSAVRLRSLFAKFVPDCSMQRWPVPLRAIKRCLYKPDAEPGMLRSAKHGSAANTMAFKLEHEPAAVKAVLSGGRRRTVTTSSGLSAPATADYLS